MKEVTTRHRRRIRIVGYDQAEAYCYGCHEWYPLTLEFWPKRDSFGRCRACDCERSKLYAARMKFDPEWRAKQIRKSRDYRAYLAGNPDLLEIDRREQRLAVNAEQALRRVRLVSVERRRAANLRSQRAWRERRRALLERVSA